MQKILLCILFPFLVSAQSSMNMNLLGALNYSNTNCSDIWGWEDSLGNEYALVGLTNGFSCVNVTNPISPIEEFFIADVSSTWRDIKTWGHYAYVTTEGPPGGPSPGLLIVDLSDMTGNTYSHVTQFTNNNGGSVSFTSSHNIYIDENGIAYIFGAKNNGSYVASGGAIFLDASANATSPEYLGEWDDYYIHDGMARGDTMYAGCIYEGKMFIVDVSNKSNPQTLGSISTPNTFTHNAWVSDDGSYVFTTDETSDAYLAAYDISNVNNIQEVDRIQSNPGSNSIPHNTHVDGNFLITSYYRDGTTVHDITYPNHMIQVAYYDSYAGSGNGFNGCWGTYPFLSSGNIISSDRDSYNGKGVLNIYGRDFQQACYLMGNVTDGITSNAISNASIEIISTSITANTNLLGSYQTASVNSGTFQAIFSAPGYASDTLNVSLSHGVMTILDAILYSSSVIPGCTDSTATNYDQTATVDDGSCLYAGCTDPLAINYDSLANVDDGSCISIVSSLTDCFGTISNVIHMGHPAQMGAYAGYNFLGLDSGIVLSTGDVSSLDTGQLMTFPIIPNTVTDPDLLTVANSVPPLIGQNFIVSSINDVAVIEFDFTPTADTLKFGFVFASDEYNGFENTMYNDVFGLFLSGPGINGTFSNNAINLAYVPNSSPQLPITVSSVNGSLNSGYYIDNSSMLNITPDGYTTPIYVKHPLTVGLTYHLKLAIADGSDGALNSYILLGDCDVVNATIDYGCTNILATNYAPYATVDDGSCIYSCDLTTSISILNATGPSTCDGFVFANATTSYSPVTFVWYDAAGTLISSGVNYVDSLCYGDYYLHSYDGVGCLVVDTFIIGDDVYGCTDTLAFNYNTLATIDDSSCVFCISTPCTSPCPMIYNPVCGCDGVQYNNSCLAICVGVGWTPAIPNGFPGGFFPCGTSFGCTDPLALNYDSTAIVDDGSCTYSTTCNEDAPTGLFVDRIIHSRAYINWDNMNSTTCTVDQYRIRYQEVGTTGWTQKTMGAPLGSCTFGNQRIDKLLLGLTGATTYEYEMKAWYCGGGASSWTALNTFTTADNCPNVGNLTAYGATTTKATFDWDASNGTYEFVRLKARVDSISTPQGSDWFQIGGSGVNYGTFTKNKNGLVAGESYRGQARAFCDPNGGAYFSLSWSPLVYWTQPTVRLEGGLAITNLDIYPNPSKDVFNITFTSEEIQSLKIRVLNLIGEEILIDNIQDFAGEYTKQINLEDNAKGIYFLEIETNDGVINKKLILQ